VSWNIRAGAPSRDAFGVCGRIKDHCFRFVGEGCNSGGYFFYRVFDTLHWGRAVTRQCGAVRVEHPRCSNSRVTAVGLPFGSDQCERKQQIAAASCDIDVGSKYLVLDPQLRSDASLAAQNPIGEAPGHFGRLE
jgi:hypothetical protein